MLKQKQKHNKTYRGKLTKRERQIRTRKFIATLLLMAGAFSTYAGWAFYQPEYTFAEVNVPKKITYAYNERVPVDIVRAEIRRQASIYGVSVECMDRIVYCESRYNNLAKNSHSTALGLSQYLIGTWQETLSFKQDRKARTDYQASLKEMALDLANGEIWRWNATKGCWYMACK